MPQTQQQIIDRRFRFIWYIALNTNNEALIRAIYRLGLLIDDNHPKANDLLDFYEDKFYKMLDDKCLEREFRRPTIPEELTIVNSDQTN